MRSRPYFNQYCVTCHNAKLLTGGLAIDKLDLHRTEANAETWEKVSRKLRAGLMPPAGAPRPERKSLDELAASNRETRSIAALPASPNPDRVPLHRHESRRVRERHPRSACGGCRRSHAAAR